MGVIGFAGAVTAFLVGLSQYKRQQLWKRHEFVVTEVRAFFDDYRCRSFLNSLIWFDTDAKTFADEQNGSVKYRNVSKDDLLKALAVPSLSTYSELQAQVNIYADYTLIRLSLFVSFVEKELCSAEDLKILLGYWLGILVKSKEADPYFQEGPGLDEVIDALQDFIVFYGYGCDRLFALLYPRDWKRKEIKKRTDKFRRKSEPDPGAILEGN